MSSFPAGLGRGLWCRKFFSTGLHPPPCFHPSLSSVSPRSGIQLWYEVIGAVSGSDPPSGLFQAPHQNPTPLQALWGGREGQGKRKGGGEEKRAERKMEQSVVSGKKCVANQLSCAINIIRVGSFSQLPGCKCLCLSWH